MPRFPSAAPGPHLTEAPRSLAPVQLIAILALALSTLIAATAVSIGLARAAGLNCVVTAHVALPQPSKSDPFSGHLLRG